MFGGAYLGQVAFAEQRLVGARQFGRPVADLATAGWTVTPLWSKLDETVIDDADLVTGVAG